MPNTLGFTIKEEPTRPPHEDPLAILPGEECFLRSVSSTGGVPQVIIPADSLNLNDSFGASHNQNCFGTVNPRGNPNNSDSEATLSCTNFGDSDYEYENDFLGFDGKCNIFNFTFEKQTFVRNSHNALNERH